MKPSDWLLQFEGHYPSLAHIAHGYVISNDDSYRFVSTWLCEGIPFAFINKPAAFSAAREALAQKLNVSFNDIGLTGSARLGYSLSPDKFGYLFDEVRSDIDLFLVNEAWFKDLSAEASCFVEELNSGKIIPRNEIEKRYWTENASRLPLNIQSGFVDSKKVPTLHRFEAFKDINQAAYSFHVNVENWVGKKFVKRTYIRVYKNWNLARKQMAYNLRKAIEFRK